MEEIYELKCELSALKRRYARLQKENENITHLYKQVAALRDFNEREKEIQIKYNQMLRDNSPDDIYLLDTGLNVLLHTSSVKTRLGRDITGEPILPVIKTIYGEESTIKVEKALCDILKLGDIYEIHISDECESYYSVRISQSFDTSGNLAGLVVIIHDNTKMHEASIKAEAATHAKSNFLANMSHEIRTPISAIIGMTNIGLSAHELERKDYCFTKIESASSHLLGVINDVLDMSKIESGNFELSKDDFNFEHMLHDVINVMVFRMDEKKQKLTVNIDHNIPKYLYGDDQRIAQIITNLLSNSIKFTPDGGSISVNANLMCFDDEETCTLKMSVTDTGIGISKEQQERLFKSFHQAENSTARKFGGTGLGLAITKSAVEMMNGNIWIESELGKGASFVFTIKLKKSINRKEFLPDWEHIRVLIKTKDADLERVVKNICKIYGAICDTNDTEHLYNICFIDVDINELIKTIRNRCDKTRICVICERDIYKYNDEINKLGIQQALRKPIFPSDIVDSVNKSLGFSPEDLAESTKIIDVSYKDYHILIAEDVEINQEIIEAVLEPTEINIDFAQDGVQVVRMFTQNPDKYDLIFMDVQMPEMDGYDATKNIRALRFSKAKKIPIIAMTANVFREDIENCIKSGMNGHLGKPIHQSDVMNMLKKYLH